MLFRKQAASAAADRMHGKVIALPRFPHVLVLSLVTFWVVLVAIWLVNGSYARKATAQGWLEPSVGLVKLYAEKPSKVAKILVDEGQLVEKGQGLMEIHDLNAFDGTDSIKEKLKSELNAQQQRIQEQIYREKDFFQTRKDRTTANKEAAQRALEILQQQQQNIVSKANIVYKQFARIEALVNRKFMTRRDLEQVRLDKIAVDNEYTNYQMQVSSKITEISEYEHELSALHEEHQNNLDRLESDLGNISQSLVQLSNQYVTTISAPKSGVVTNLQTIVGQQIRANDLLLHIGETADELEMIIYMPVSAAGFVEKGLELSVRYDSFPHQKFGIYSAAVTDVSSTILLPSDISSSPIQVRTPVYRLKAKANEQAIRAYGRNFPLKQGMTLTADIVLENRSVIAWLLEPIISLRGRI